MGLDSSDYQTLLLNLLPPGPAWPRDDSQSSRWADGLSQELARLDARADVLVEEADPRTTSELLADWERVAGLPDCCAPLDQVLTEGQRRALLVHRLTETGGQSREYYIQLAAYYGYNIGIQEIAPHTCNSDCQYPVYGQEWQFVWKVFAGSTTITYFNANSSGIEPIAKWGDPFLECLLNSVKPAHTVIIFCYSSIDVLRCGDSLLNVGGALLEIKP